MNCLKIKNLCKNKRMFTFNYNNNDLNKYYNIRKNIFKKTWNINYLRDEYDNKDNIIIIKEKEKVIGGVSAIISRNNKRILLPGEKLYKYNYNVVISDLNKLTYGELSRFFVIDDERKTEVNKILFLKALEKFEHNKCDYIFGVCPEKLVNYYKYMFNNNGYTFDITKDKIYINNKITYSYLSISKKI